MDMTKSPPARGGLTHPDDKGSEGWVTATHCPPAGWGGGVTSSGDGKGLDSRIPSSSPGVGY